MAKVEVTREHAADCWCKASAECKEAAKRIAEAPDQAEVYATASKELMLAEERGRAAERAWVIAECERTERTSPVEGAHTVAAMRVRFQRGEHVGAAGKGE